MLPWLSILESFDTRNQIKDPATIMRSIDDFMELKDTHIKEFPVKKRLVRN